MSAPEGLDSNAPPYPTPGRAALDTLMALFTGAFVALLWAPDIDISSVGIGQVVGFGLFGALASMRVPGPHSERMGLRGFERHWLVPLLLLLPMALLLSEVDNWIAVWLPPSAEYVERWDEAHELFTGWSLVQIAIVQVGILPVVHEWFFRGVIQQGLVAHRGPMGGIFLTALLFVPCYANAAPELGPALSSLITALAFGLVLGALRLATGSVVAPMLFHALWAGAGLAALQIAPEYPIAGFNTAPGEHTPVLLLAIAGVAVFAGAKPVWNALIEPPLPTLPPRQD